MAKLLPFSLEIFYVHLFSDNYISVQTSYMASLKKRRRPENLETIDEFEPSRQRRRLDTIPSTTINLLGNNVDSNMEIDQSESNDGLSEHQRSEPFRRFDAAKD